MLTLIANSSQSKWPSGSDPWVKATLKAVDKCSKRGDEIIASVGTSSWELPLWRAASNGTKLHMICPISAEVDREQYKTYIMREFAIDSNQAQWQWIETNTRRRTSGWRARDRMAVKLADRIEVICVRASGRLATEIAQYKKGGKSQVPYVRRKRCASWQQRLPNQLAPIWPDGALVHLTRSSDGPWPQETKRSYYEAIVESMAYPRSGYDTLRRIVLGGRIIGTRFRSPQNTPRVCLTACTPREAAALIRFRARYARYSFEPYGIAIDRSAAMAAGARPVVYGSNARTSVFGQGSGKQGIWEKEREWRVMGDLELTHLKHRDVIVVTSTQAEAQRLGRQCPYEVRSFGCSDWR